MKWYLRALKKYAVFEGRAQRKEYWFFSLFNLTIVLLLSFLEGLLDIAAKENMSLLAMAYWLAVLLPALAVSVRRLHDIGRTGWWLLMSLVPLVGGIVLFVFFVTESEAGENNYGQDPTAGQW